MKQIINFARNILQNIYYYKIVICNVNHSGLLMQCNPYDMQNNPMKIAITSFEWFQIEENLSDENIIKKSFLRTTIHELILQMGIVP